MFQLSPVVIASALALIHCSIAQQYPPPVTYDTTALKSPINPNITISYKEPDPGTCLTTFSTQKQYTGYVNLPPFTLAPYQQNYSINTFFWFFEARTSPETAPLTIWLNGGPGSSSMIGLFRESGPCEVIQSADGSYGTQANLWGWDRSSNVLFIDQPTQTGFSYDDAVNASFNLQTGDLVSPPTSRPNDALPWSYLNGTFSSGHEYSTQNTSVIAASASWHFLQGFLSAFPKYNPGTRPNSTTTEPTGINLFAESYGGVYGPAFANYFEAQNAKRLTGDISRNSTLEIKLTSIGIINGLVDELIQAPTWPKFAYNNTYGVQTIDQTTQLNALSDFSAPGGCKDLINQCRASMTANDPQAEGDNLATNSICQHANDACNQILSVASSSDRSVYDIRVQNPNSFPNYAYLEYLNNADVLRSIGAKVNFTETSYSVYDAFSKTGDAIRGTQLTSLASLLAQGIRVAFIYGDADLICNWYGGEAVSLELAQLLPAYSTAFPAAGYADIIPNNSYIGGQVRQYGNLSFSRIYDAGHTVPSYQAETAFTVFTRIIEGNDVGTGNDIDISTFGTKGPKYSNYRNKVPAQPKNTCWIRAIHDTCTDLERTQMFQGTGVVKNGIWLQQESDFNPPESHSIVGKPGSVPTNTPTVGTSTTSSIPLTGVFTATGTPTPTSGASSTRFLFRIQPGDLIPSKWWPARFDPHVDVHVSNQYDTSRTELRRLKARNILPNLAADCGSDCDYDSEDDISPLSYAGVRQMDPERRQFEDVFPHIAQGPLPHDVIPLKPYYDPEEDEEDERKKKRNMRGGLGGGLGGLGALLLISLLALLIRRRRGRKQASPLPVTRNVETVEPDPRRTFVQRFARSPTIPPTTPAVVPVDIEQPETPPAFPEDRRPSRMRTLPMEPIPERDSFTGPPRTERVAVGTPRESLSPPGTPRRLSTHPNEPIDSPTPVVQRSVDPPSRQPTQYIAEAPTRQPTEHMATPPSRQPTQPTPVLQRSVEEPTPGPTRQPTAVEPVPGLSRKPTTVIREEPAPVSRKATVTDEEPVRPVQRSASLPLEESAPTRSNTVPPELTRAPTRAPTRAATLPAEQSPELESSPTQKPTVLKRIRETWRHSLGSSEAAPGVIQELQEKKTEQPPTPPARILTTIPEPPPMPPSKAPMAEMAPSRAGTAPLIEVRDEGDQVPDVKVNL